MADWNNPALASNYVDFLTNLKDRDLDVAKLFFSLPTNPVTNMVRLNRGPYKFQEYLAGAWTDILLGLEAGGTGASNPLDARVNLGLGSLALQNANNVNITGGLITGIAFAASVITSGNLNVARMPTGGQWALTTLLELTGHAFLAKSLGAAYRSGGTTTLTDTDYLYECLGGTINLPDCTTIIGRIYVIKRSGTAVTLDPAGAQVISVNGTDVTTYSGLGQSQSIILQSNGSKWVAITTGGTVYRDNQFVTITLGTGNSVENQALSTQVNEVKKAKIIALSELSVPAAGSGGNFPIKCHFANSAGTEIIFGPATHIRISCNANNAFSPIAYYCIVEERE